MANIRRLTCSVKRYIQNEQKVPPPVEGVGVGVLGFSEDFVTMEASETLLEDAALTISATTKEQRYSIIIYEWLFGNRGKRL